MKLIENNWWLSKQVEYKGNLLIVPVWTNWVATDANGLMVAYKGKPEYVWGANEKYGWWESDCDYESLGQTAFEEGESWKESLAYVGEEQ